MPKNAASPTLPTTHQPLSRDPRFLPHSRTHFANGKPPKMLRSVADSLTPKRRFQHAPLQLTLAAWFLVFCQPTSVLLASDWPQILGPNRDGQTQAALIQPQDWPKRLSPTWEAPVGAGFAAPIVVGDQVILFSRIGDQEVVQAFGSASGKSIWKVGWPSEFLPRINPDPGPRATPASDGKVVVCWGAEGVAAAVEIATGKLRWQRPLRKEYGARDGYFGAGSSPIIVDDVAVFCVGARDNAGVVAVSLASGKTVWRATSYDSSYASPILTTLGSENLLVVPMRLNTVVLDPATGEVLGDVKFGSRGTTVNAASPVAVGNDSIWLTSNYGIGSTLFQFTGGSTNELLRGSRLLGSHYDTPVVVGGVLFGIDGYEGQGNVSLRAIDPVSQKLLWQQDDFGTAHLLAFKDYLLALSLDGRVTVLRGARDSFQPVVSTTVSKPGFENRSIPAFCGGALFLRNNSSAAPGGESLFRFDLK